MRPAAVIASVLVIGTVYLAARRLQDESDSIDPDLIDFADLMLSELTPSPVAAMRPSSALLAMLREGEALRLTRYRLGDGGWTIGYGRYYPDGGAVPPERITRDQAEAWFLDDVEARGARWVRAYVSVPLMQRQFDALVHMAFNLKPSSFKTIAQAVNAGDDPEAAAMRYVRAGTNLERGLRNRRERELALYRMGTYA
jgi:lysozyme